MLKVGDKVKFKTNMPDDVRFGWNEGMREELAGEEFVISAITEIGAIQGHGTMWLVSEDMLERVREFKVGDKVKFKDHAQEGIGEIVSIDQGLYSVKGEDTSKWRFFDYELTLIEDEPTTDEAEFTDVERSMLKALVENTLDEFDSYEILRETLLSLHDKL